MSDALSAARRRAARLPLGIALAGVLAALGFAALMIGPYPLSPGEVVAALAGQGAAQAEIVVWQVRLPRVAAALLVGAALAAAGAAYQTLFRNPLVSPDILGVSAGAGLGAVLGIFPALAIPGLGSLVVFLAVFAIWRYVSLASVLAAAALPLWVWYFFSLSATRLAERGADQQLERFETKPTVYLVAAMALAAFAIWKHRDNIQRLVDGTEPKVGSRGKHRS